MTLEERRYQLQQSLDNEKSQEQRNVLGQFSTPFSLAKDIVTYVLGIDPGQKHLEMIEPACGMGVFFSALQDVMGLETLDGCLGFEIDPHYYSPAVELWQETGVDIRCADFLSQVPFKKFPLLIANPPYSRHHHIPLEQKQMLQEATLRETGIRISGLSGLYCYFLMLSTRWLQEGALSCWLIPSEFMDVNYGEAVKQYLLENVDLVSIHRFDERDLQFSDALITSSVVVFRNQKPSGHPVLFSYGSSICNPSKVVKIDRCQLDSHQKWTHHFDSIPQKQLSNQHVRVLGDYFEVKRGIATGCNSFFIVNEETIARYQLPKEYLTAILPAPRNMKGDVFKSSDCISDTGLYLFSTSDDEATIASKYPSVLEYIKKGVEKKVHEKYICSRHAPWYNCEKRNSAPFVIPYMGRGEKGRKLFRFILNQSDAIATNGYLLIYPKPEFAYLFRNPDFTVSVWQCLNTISTEDFEHNGRFYGGGLHKLEPRELLSIPIEGLEQLFGNELLFVA
ncbi:MAG: Eco57I restriction-modification methylase domain-containing protein [Prevotella sp.]|nr:Eco57I restriction-modification methylase domain-containing protein [Prevotella sp.]